MSFRQIQILNYKITFFSAFSENCLQPKAFDIYSKNPVNELSSAKRNHTPIAIAAFVQMPVSPGHSRVILLAEFGYSAEGANGRQTFDLVEFNGGELLSIHRIFHSAKLNF